MTQNPFARPVRARSFSARQLSQPIISYDVGAPIRRGEIGQTNRWNLAQAGDLCGFDPSVTRDDLEVVGDEDGIKETKPLDRPRNLFQLLLGMPAGVVRGGTQTLGRKVCDLKIRQSYRPGRRPCTDGSRHPTNVVKIRTLDHGRLRGFGFANPNQAPWSGAGVLLRRGDCPEHGPMAAQRSNRSTTIPRI